MHRLSRAVASSDTELLASGRVIGVTIDFDATFFGRGGLNVLLGIARGTIDVLETPNGVNVVAQFNVRRAIVMSFA